MAFIFNKMKKKMWARILALLLLSGLGLQTACLHDFDIRVGTANDSELPPDGCTGQYYFYDLNNYFSAWNTTKSITYTNTGSLPPGLKLNKIAGIISGTPTKIGWYKFNIEVKDSANTTLEKDDLFIKINNFSIVTSGLLPPICLKNPYSAVIHICGGTPPFNWQILKWSPETQPLFFSSKTTTVRYNTISGTPDKCYRCYDDGRANYSFYVVVTDKDNKNMADKRFNFYVTKQPTILSPYKLPPGFVGQSYTHDLLACGGTPPYEWNKTGGSLPPGLSLSKSGKIDGGSPTTAGNFAFKVELDDQDELDRTLEGMFNIRVVAAPLKVTNRNFTFSECTLVNTQIGGATYVSGGYGPRYWKRESGTIPAGLTLTPEGYLKGQPAAPGTYNFEASVNDATTNPVSPPTAQVVVKVNPYPADTAGIVVERFRQLNYGTTGYKENEIDLSLNQKVRVDFRITDAGWEKTWNNLAANKKQVTLKIFGICSGDKKNAIALGYGNADGDTDLEHIARFDLNDFKTLINAAGGTAKSPFNFRIIVQNLESSTKLIKTFKNVKVK